MIQDEPFPDLSILGFTDLHLLWRVSSVGVIDRAKPYDQRITSPRFDGGLSWSVTFTNPPGTFSGWHGYQFDYLGIAVNTLPTTPDNWHYWRVYPTDQPDGPSPVPILRLIYQRATYHDSPLYAEVIHLPNAPRITAVKPRDPNNRGNNKDRERAWRALDLLQLDRWHQASGRPPKEPDAKPDRTIANFAERYPREYACWRETHDGERPTQLELAGEFGVSERTLQRHIKDNRLTWPPDA